MVMMGVQNTAAGGDPARGGPKAIRGPFVDHTACALVNDVRVGEREPRYHIVCDVQRRQTPCAVHQVRR